MAIEKIRMTKLLKFIASKCITDVPRKDDFLNFSMVHGKYVVITADCSRQVTILVDALHKNSSLTLTP